MIDVLMRIAVGALVLGSLALWRLVSRHRPRAPLDDAFSRHASGESQPWEVWR